MTLFALSLDSKAGNWYDNLPDNSFTTLADFKTAFLGKFGSKKEQTSSSSFDQHKEV